MFRPISFNVIKQALEWHGFAVPQLRLMSFSDHDPDAVTAEYLAVWDEWQLDQKYFVAPGDGKLQGIAIFQQDLQACFCDDVEVRQLQWHSPHEQMSAMLYVRVDRATFALQAQLTLWNA